MNTNSNLKKAIATRGTQPPASMNMQIMAAVKLAEARRSRRRLWTNVILAVVGVFSVAAALVVYCGEMFAVAFRALRFDGMSASIFNLDLLSLLAPPVVLLLLAELLIQRHFYRQDVAKIHDRM